MSVLDEILAFLAKILGGSPIPSPSGDEPLMISTPRVLVINFDPIVDAQGRTLTKKMGWFNVDQLIQTFIADIDEVSHGLVKYQYDSANRIDVDAFPAKQDGFQYTPAAYLAMMQNEPSHHEPDGVDYWKIVNDYQLINRVEANLIDEVWIFGGPYFGFWESQMVGQGAIWCNSSPLSHSEQCSRRFVIMGFNYQRSPAQMIHNMGHRMESIMGHVYNSLGWVQNAYGAVNPYVQPSIGPDKFTNPRNDLEKFLLYEKIAPGRAGIGTIHTPCNGDKDYDWQNPNQASSSCDDWMAFPNGQGTRRNLNGGEWNWNEYDYIKWWFKHVPHVKGSKNGILNNWWRYANQVDLPFRG